MTLPDASSPPTEGDTVHWLILTFADWLRYGLALLARRYPEVRGTQRCARCGHRS